MSFGIQKNVFWLQISINYVVLVKTSDSINHFSGVDFGSPFAKLTFFSKISEHLTTVQKVNEEVQFGLRLEGVMETHDIWVLNLFEDISFSYIKQKLFLNKLHEFLVLTLGLDEKVLLDELILSQNLHRVRKTVILLSDQIHFAEGSSTNNLEEFEIIEGYLLAWNQEVNTFFIRHFWRSFFLLVVFILCSWIIEIFNIGFLIIFALVLL